MRVISQGPTRTSPATSAHGTSVATSPSARPTERGAVARTSPAVTSAATGNSRPTAKLPPHDRRLSPSVGPVPDMGRAYDHAPRAGTVPWYGDRGPAPMPVTQG